jgi:hypothetical protein
MSPSDQLWFFLKEEMVLPKFTQKQYTLFDVQTDGITLQNCLNITSTQGSTERFAFYIHSASMAAAVRMLTDESIWVTYKLYCQNDPVVMVLIRDANDPSPNTSRAPSYNNSFAERRKVSRGKIIPEIFIQPPVRHASGSMDVSTMERIDDVPEFEKVTLNLGNENFETFTKEYLLCTLYLLHSLQLLFLT